MWFFSSFSREPLFLMFIIWQQRKEDIKINFPLVIFFPPVKYFSITILSPAAEPPNISWISFLSLRISSKLQLWTSRTFSLIKTTFSTSKKQTILNKITGFHHWSSSFRFPQTSHCWTPQCTCQTWWPTLNQMYELNVLLCFWSCTSSFPVVLYLVVNCT